MNYSTITYIAVSFDSAGVTGEARMWAWSSFVFGAREGNLESLMWLSRGRDILKIGCLEDERRIMVKDRVKRGK